MNTEDLSRHRMQNAGQSLLLVLSMAALLGTLAFAIGGRVYTTQNHPEMSADFAAALIEEYAGKLPEEVVGQARASLSARADYEEFAETVARFFEQADAGPAA